MVVDDHTLFRKGLIAILSDIPELNIVGEAENAFVVTVVPPQRAFNGNAITLTGDHDGLFQQRRLGTVEIFDEG